MSGFALDPERARPKPATRHTIEFQRSVRSALPFEDRRSFENARRGFIASLDPLTIPREGGRRPAYDLARMAFLEGECPDTVNPSLWRQAQLNALHHGLFEIADGLYQVRSFDIANMTLIRADTGWIIVDPLTAAETSRAALALANEQLGSRPVIAVIHTHSHADHFAGVLGVVNPADVAAGRVTVIAPEHYVNEALSENVLAGNAMNRRATYMYGNLLEPGPSAFVTTGLGAALSMGSTAFVVPNDIVRVTGERRTIGGIDIEFQMTPGTEAPAEFVFYLPQFKALCMSEITSHHLHNVYTLRGAQVRDALRWSGQIDEAIARYGDALEILFACHHWPIWGRVEAFQYLKSQRDLYKYLHDQVLRLANHGFTKEEIAEQLRLPESLERNFSNRGYYGTVYHNACAVYVKYLGFFDGNPATLHRLPPAEAGARYVEFMGGEQAVLEKCASSFERGEYRWTAEVLNHVVMSNPASVEGRALLADTLEQLGYQAESAVWRNFYLCGALELRRDAPSDTAFTASEGMAEGMPLENVFQTMAVRLNGTKAAGYELEIDAVLSDLGERYRITVDNAVLRAFRCESGDGAEAELLLTGLDFKRLMLGVCDAGALIDAGRLQISGRRGALDELMALFDSFVRRFPIVTPRGRAPA